MGNITETSKSIKTVQEFKDEVAEKIAGREQVMFQIGDLAVKENKLTYGDVELSKDATQKILGHLRVRPNFLDLNAQMSEEDWETVSGKLKEVHASQNVYGNIVTADNSLTDVFLASQKAPVGGIRIPEIFDAVVESLLNASDDDFVLKQKSFLEDKDTVVLDFLQDGKEYDAFKNGEDVWKAGKRITWSGLHFDIAPYFERLTCANGNVGRQFGFSSNVTKNKYNLGKINMILEREISNGNDAFTPMLLDGIRHMKKHNVSVREFLALINFFDVDKDVKILKKFNDEITKINKAYGVDIESMHNIWKSTADTNVNVYDFFNDLTYIASHPDEIKMDDYERKALQIKASDLMFRETFDLEMVAPKVTW